jgi:hypothetical protein
MTRSRLSIDDADVELLINLASDDKRKKMCAAVCESVLRERDLIETPIVRDVLFLVQNDRVASAAQLAALEGLAESREEEYWTKRKPLDDTRQPLDFAVKSLSLEAAALNALRFAARGMTRELVSEAVYEALCAAVDAPKLIELAKSLLRWHTAGTSRVTAGASPSVRPTGALFKHQFL